MIWFLLALGCRPAVCGKPVADDPDDLVSDEVLAVVQATIDAFWVDAGNPEMCVPEVNVVGQLRWNDASVAGGYNDATHEVRLAADRIVAVEDPGWQTFYWTTVVRHELCHALDDAYADLSLARPDLYPEGSVDDHELYPTVADRTREAFAEACESGPLPWQESVAIGEACGTPWAGEQARHLAEEVWRGWEDPAEIGEALELRRQQVFAPDRFAMGGFAAVAGRVWWFTTAQFGRGALRAQPATGGRADTYRAEGLPSGDLLDEVVLSDGADSGRLLTWPVRIDTGERLPAVAWRFDDQGTARVPVPPVWDAERGLVVKDTWYLPARVTDDGPLVLLVIAPDGAYTTILPPDGYTNIVAVRSHPEGLQLTLWNGHDRARAIRHDDGDVTIEAHGVSWGVETAYGTVRGGGASGRHDGADAVYTLVVERDGVLHPVSSACDTSATSPQLAVGNALLTTHGSDRGWTVYSPGATFAEATVGG